MRGEAERALFSTLSVCAVLMSHLDSSYPYQEKGGWEGTRGVTFFIRHVVFHFPYMDEQILPSPLSLVTKENAQTFCGDA